MAKHTKEGISCNYVNLSEGTGHLVFEFGRVLEYLQSVSRARGQHLFWMFENVASMRADIRDTISECFKVFMSSHRYGQSHWHCECTGTVMLLGGLQLLVI